MAEADDSDDSFQPDNDSDYGEEAGDRSLSSSESEAEEAEEAEGAEAAEAAEAAEGAEGAAAASSAASQGEEHVLVRRGEDRRTRDYMSRFEQAHLLAQRAAQINATGVHHCRRPEHLELTSAVELAMAEMREGRCPLAIRRYVGQYNGQPLYEVWSASELAMHPSGCGAKMGALGGASYLP